MTWSYIDPGASAKDAVRFLISDTDKCDQLLQDKEIEYVLGLYNNTPINAAIRCCEVITAKFSRMADETVGQVRISFSQKSKAYRDMRNDLVNRLAVEDATPFAGGISRTSVQTIDANADRVPPAFTRNMMNNWTLSPWIIGQEIQFWGWI